MKIRIARDGEEIARLDGVEMLLHAVHGSSVRLEDHAFQEGSEDWITVGQLLDQEGVGGEIVPTGDKSGEVTHTPSSDPLADVIRARPTQSGTPTEGREARKRHRAYATPLVFLGVAALLVAFALSQQERIAGVDIPVLAPKAVKEAGSLFKEGAELYQKGTRKWYNDDEDLLNQALNRFENAWESLHDGAEYPDGDLISDEQYVKLLRDELEDRIKECRSHMNWLPWPW